MVVGVTEGYEKVLEVNGVGYRASKSGKVLTLNLGYSHPVEMNDPEGIESKVSRNKIVVSGMDRGKSAASTQLKSEIREDLNLTKERVSNMLMEGYLDVRFGKTR